VNFTNYRVSPPHLVFDEASRLAAKLGVRATGSELVGLIPKEALLMAGRYYLEKQGKSSGVPEDELVRTAVISLGLNDVAPFDADKKIIENQFKETGKSLASMSLRAFADELSMDSPTPGGGSVAAYCGALSAALSSMVSNLTFGKKGYEDVGAEMASAAVAAQALKDDLLGAVDRDTRAFNKVMEALRLPKTTPEQAREKETALEEATKEATLVPLEVLEKSVEAVRLAKVVASRGFKSSASDAGVGGLTGAAAGEGAYYNVLINLPGIKDAKFRARVHQQAAKRKAELDRLSLAIRKIIEGQLKKQDA
jgi:glutamate formiminotransferase/formiminotetrahydrofolate cyclodeaminase